MALTFPRDMPDFGVSTQSFEVERVDFLSVEGRGRVGSVQSGDPLWKASWVLGAMDADEGDIWPAFKASMRGASRLFVGRDLRRPFPLAYVRGFPASMTRFNGDGFDGSALDWSQTIDAEGNAILKLEGLPSGMPLSIGDYVGFRWASTVVDGMTARALVCALEPARVAANGEVFLNVDPPVPVLAAPGVVPADAVAWLNKPECLMRMTPDSAMGPRDALHQQGGTINAIQDLIP